MFVRLNKVQLVQTSLGDFRRCESSESRLSSLRIFSLVVNWFRFEQSLGGGGGGLAFSTGLSYLLSLSVSFSRKLNQLNHHPSDLEFSKKDEKCGARVMNDDPGSFKDWRKKIFLFHVREGPLFSP